MPTHSNEKTRLDTQHRGLTLARGSLCGAQDLVDEILKPTSDGQQKTVVDMGTGSGAW